MSDNLEKLYEKYNILSDAKDNIKQHATQYLEAMDCIKGSENEKMLAAQILSKFFKHFPEVQDNALNALLDLCEDDEVKIRACAMRYLVTICKDAKDHIVKVTDILAQMMQLDEQRDYTTASWCLLQLSKEDPVVVIKTLFNHIQALNNIQAREKCVDFIYKKLLRSIDSQPSDIEDLVIEESKQILTDASCDEFINIMNCLMQTKLIRTQSGCEEVLQSIADMMEINNDFDPFEEGCVSRVITCIKYALELFSANNESTKFVIYLCDQVLPHFEAIGGIENGQTFQLQILRDLADASTLCGKFENPSLHVVQIFDKLKIYMPLPPTDGDVYKMPNFEFSFVECLLYAFHRLARQCPDFLTHDPQILNDLRLRLTYFSRGVQGCNKAMTNKTTENLDPANALKAKIAPAVLSNITALIKDLYHQPPIYKCNVVLSYKSVHAEDIKKTVNQKRHAPITFDNSNGTATKQYRTNKSNDNVKLYQPPSGKFSNNFQNYDKSVRGGKGRNHRGRMRGGGRNWRK